MPGGGADNADRHLDTVEYMAGTRYLLRVAGMVHYKIWKNRVYNIVDCWRIDDLQCCHDFHQTIDGQPD